MNFCFSMNSCFLVPSLPMYTALLLPIALLFTYNLITAALTVYRLRRVKSDGDSTSREPTALRLMVAVSIWMLLTTSLCSGFLSMHSTTHTAPVIFGVTNCILVRFHDRPANVWFRHIDVLSSFHTMLKKLTRLEREASDVVQ